MGWVEERAERLWQSLGAAPDMERLLMLLGDRVTIFEAPGETGWCIHHADGHIDIWAATGARFFTSFTHELGHALCTTGLALHLLPFAPRLARIQSWKEEAIANRFAAALAGYWHEE
jgi:hypothetical protein